MKRLKCTVIGNSVALRVRPNQPLPQNLNYSQILESLLTEEFTSPGILVENKSYGAYTVHNAINNIDTYIQTFPDFFIVNFGVVDASTREIPLWFYRLAQSKKDRLINKISSAVYRNIFMKFRPNLVKLRGKRSWISKKKFTEYYDYLLKQLLKETNAHIIALPVNIANDRVEKELPGSLKKHKQYNAIIKKIVEKYNQSSIDLSFLNSEEHYPDGVHYSLKGHHIVAEELFKEIKKIMNA